MEKQFKRRGLFRRLSDREFPQASLLRGGVESRTSSLCPSDSIDMPVVPLGMLGFPTPECFVHAFALEMLGALIPGLFLAPATPLRLWLYPDVLFLEISRISEKFCVF